jgi:hypothetical protein
MIKQKELNEISESIENSIERIKFLDSSNKFENQEIQILQTKVQGQIDYLRKLVKVTKIKESGLKLIKE